MTRLDDSLRAAQLEAAAPDVVAEDFGGEMVVLNLTNGKYFSLPGLTASLWRDLADGCPVETLAAAAKAAGPAVVESVESLAAGLVGEGLLRPRTAPVAASPRTSFDGVAAVPAMESYDDMADLILADPVHDVEEAAGWPVRRDSGKGG